MEWSSAPNPADDFVVVDQPECRHDLPIRARTSHQGGVEDDDNISDSDDELERISRPGSVRSLSTSSPTPSTYGSEYEEDAQESDNAKSRAEDANSSQQESPRDTSRPSQGVFDRFQLPKPESEAPKMINVKHSPPSYYNYQSVPQHAYPGTRVLVPHPLSRRRGSKNPCPPPNWLSATTKPPANTRQLPDPLCDANPPLVRERKPMTSKRCDHGILDQYIMDLFIESALHTRIQQEFGSAKANERDLRQQMMARLRNLPVDHPVVREAMRHARGAAYLFQDQYRNAEQRNHIYTTLFTEVELIAVYLVSQSHLCFFETDCTFFDVSNLFNGQPLQDFNKEVILQGVKLALDTQKAWWMSLSNFQAYTCFEQLKRDVQHRLAVQQGALGYRADDIAYVLDDISRHLPCIKDLVTI